MARAGKIFVSYRRNDTATIAGRMVDWISQYIPRKDIFFDIETVDYGDDFVKKIHQTIPQCRAVLALIGPHWLNDDGTIAPYVSMELKLALELKIPIIPVLVEHTTMPALEAAPPEISALKTLNAAQVRSGKDFTHDMEDLSKVLGIRLRRRRDTLIAITSVSALAVVIGAVIILGAQGQLPWSPLSPSVAVTVTAGARDAAATAAVNATATALTASVDATTTTISANNMAATATAVALAPYTYVAQAPGSCSATGDWTNDTTPNSAYTCNATSAHWHAAQDGSQLPPGDYGDTIVFRGASGFTFPVNYVASVEFSNIDSSCTALSVYQGSEASSSSVYTDTVVVCHDGQWSAQLLFGADKDAGLNQLQSGSIPPSNVYTLTITYSSANSSAEIDLAINDQTVLKSSGLELLRSEQPIISLSQSCDPFARGTCSADVANFHITPLQ